MPPKEKPTASVNQKASNDKNVIIQGDVNKSVVISGDHNTVNQTIIQKIFNIFKSDSETLELRNRRILLGHIENFWIKGVLEKSLHGAALLELGIKEDPSAIKTYPWAIKKESTNETLPAETSMLDIFNTIGMGRSLLILGAPGAGKTTMLLELARQLIQRAREDVTESIPIVFNLASWTEKLTLVDWLARELNTIYSVPRKTAPDWIKENKLFLLLDGLDEVRQESRTKCIEVINEFRKEHGMTSLAVCSRSQDYAELNAKLSFEGAIEIQPLTQKQITGFFNRFGKEMAGIKQVLKKDSTLREMAETPLFWSVMIMAYRDKQDVEIFASGDENEKRKHLFDTYIERMFERPRSKNVIFKKHHALVWLSWLAQGMINHNQIPFLFENIHPKWLPQTKSRNYRLLNGVLGGLIFGAIGGLSGGLNGILGGGWSRSLFLSTISGFHPFLSGMLWGLDRGLTIGLISGVVLGMIIGFTQNPSKIKLVDSLTWNWKPALRGLIIGLLIEFVLILALAVVVITGNYLFGTSLNLTDVLILGALGLLIGLIFSPIFASAGFLIGGLTIKIINETSYPGQRISLSIRNFFIVILLLELSMGLIIGLVYWLFWGLLLGTRAGSYNVPMVGLTWGVIFGLLGGVLFGGMGVIQQYILRVNIALRNLLPWRLVPFLNHCVDLIFLRRVGGGYIFVHRMLMEHFAEMYQETDK